MSKLKLLVGLAVLGIVTIAGWHAGAAEVANIKLRDDMQDMASQLGIRIGLSGPKSDDDFRTAVLAKARQYEIELTPEQVIVQRTGSELAGTLSISADYTVPIHLPGISFKLHFTPTSGTKAYDFTHLAPVSPS